jgi:hypothetical protein
VIDNLLAAAWTCLAVTNFTMAASTFANMAVGLGAVATLILTMLRIYEHLAGEPISETITGDGDS